jgi:HAD superfamily hydrolase (TIGR01484 family)
MKIVFSDFDGTLTLGHSLSPIFFDVLNLLDQKKIPLIIVSGRSLSWGHFFLTHFPQIEAAIMEGGGVIVRRGAQGLMEEENVVDDNEIDRLGLTTDLLLQENPWIHLSKDSFGRRCDRAIELCEYTDNEKEVIFNFLKKHKINYSCSNVHINFWAGEISKYKAVELYLNKYKKDLKLSECIYFGDAPNDQSMFHFFENSVGVSNIKNYLSQMQYPPKIILEGSENEMIKGVFNYLKSQL